MVKVGFWRCRPNLKSKLRILVFEYLPIFVTHFWVVTRFWFFCWLPSVLFLSKKFEVFVYFFSYELRLNSFFFFVHCLSVEMR